MKVSVHQRVDDTMVGLTRFGRILDSDRINQMSLDLTATDLKEWRDRLSDITPAILVY